MNSKKAKALRRQAKQYTQHLPEVAYKDGKLGECTKGAYRALKRGRVADKRESGILAE